MEVISSAKNPKIKNVIKLQEKSSERRRQGLTVVEGAIELRLCFEAGCEIETLLVCEDLADPDLLDYFTQNKDIRLLYITEPIFQKVAYREKSTGIIGLAKPPTYTLEHLTLPSNPLIIVLESVEKPGNLGAILRTADAAGVDAILLCNTKTDLTNPNTIRASIGCAFTVPMVSCSNEEAVVFLNQHKIKTYGAALTASKPYTEIDFLKSTAIIMGTEATGLSDFWLENTDQNIIIPMHGKIDSMNVSVATAILTFEVVRQRVLYN